MGPVGIGGCARVVCRTKCANPAPLSLRVQEEDHAYLRGKRSCVVGRLRNVCATFPSSVFLMRIVSTLLIGAALALVILAMGTMPMWLGPVRW